jgi:hypothetical protein
MLPQTNDYMRLRASLSSARKAVSEPRSSYQISAVGSQALAGQ